MLIIITLNFIGGVKILNKIERDENFVFKINLFIIELYIIQNLFFMILNLIFGITIVRSYLIIFIFILYLLKFSFIEARIMVLIWKKQILKNNNNLSRKELQKKFLLYQIKISFMMLFYFYITWNIFLNPIIIFFNSFIFLPQIFHNIFYPAISKFEPFLCIFIVFANFFVFLYLRFFPTHFLGFENFFTMPFLGFCFLSTCLIFLILQDFLGPKFLCFEFIEKKINYRFFKNYKNYLKFLNKKNKLNISIQSENDNFLENDICSICFDDFLIIENNNKNNIVKKFKIEYLKKFSLKFNTKKIMLTPCNHIFHPNCLLKWMDVRMECPCCKSILPHLE